MNVTQGRIADIQRASVHDGPGLRTTVFFKGCPLHCTWCHNPECIDFAPQELFYPQKCIGCGLCDQGCYAGARVLCGKTYTVSELMRELMQDAAYYAAGGGVTFSGGEPLSQPAFLLQALHACHRAGIHCAIETSLVGFDEEIFRATDLVMADLKIWNSQLHRQYTGLGNEGVKEHFQRLNELGVPIIARTPVLCEIDQEIPQISAFLHSLTNVIRYELLPYHPLGLEKARALACEQRKFTVPTKEYMQEVNQYAFIR